MQIERQRGVIPACDVTPQQFEVLLAATADLPHITAYKVGATLALTIGLPEVVKIARRHTQKPLIYDHQKAGTDIPDTGRAFAHLLRESGIDAVILFPLSGPETEIAWIEAALSEQLVVIIGSQMTHPRFLVSDGGYIADEAIERMLVCAAERGIRNYVVPGTRPAVIRQARSIIQRYVAEPTLYTPGLITQGGAVADCREAAGDRWQAIVGRAIFGASDMRAAAVALAPSVE